MAITGLDYDLLTASDLRDSDGHTMKLIKLNGFVGTYESGGAVIDPDWVDLSEITFISAQPVTAMPFAGADEPWSLVSMTSIMRVDQGIANGEAATGVFEWRILPYLYDGTAFNELADGSSLEFADGFESIILLVGAP